ncbi:MAG: hypothetical protein ACR2JG_10795 [Geodermatophilaceae bacterium]
MSSNLSSARIDVADGAAATELFLQRGWTDGLPIVAPTPELVSAFVAAVGGEPDDVLGGIPEQNRSITLEKLAVNAVMAGCRLEYMSLLVATVRALSREPFNLHSTTVSGATAPLLIVSGPAVSKLGLNSGFSVFGPGHHANATIGRAVRLLLQNVCGGVPGAIDKSTFGHPGKFSYCIAESQGRNPWQAAHVDRGLAADCSAVTVFAGEAPIFARNDWADTPEPILATIADAMLPSHFTGGGVVVVLGPLHAATMSAAGMSKADVREGLFQRARRSLGDLRRAGRLPGEPEAADDTTYRSVVPSADDIFVVVAGGHLYGYSAVVPSWVGGHESVAVTEGLDDEESARCVIVTSSREAGDRV